MLPENLLLSIAETGHRKIYTLKLGIYTFQRNHVIPKLDFDPWVLESGTLNPAHKSWTPNSGNFGRTSSAPGRPPILNSILTLNLHPAGSWPRPKVRYWSLTFRLLSLRVQPWAINQKPNTLNLPNGACSYWFELPPWSSSTSRFRVKVNEPLAPASNISISILIICLFTILRFYSGHQHYFFNLEFLTHPLCFFWRRESSRPGNLVLNGVGNFW